MVLTCSFTQMCISPQNYRLTSTVPSSLETCWCSSSTKTASTIGTYENTKKVKKKWQVQFFFATEVYTDHHGCRCGVWNPHWKKCCWEHEAKHQEPRTCAWRSSLASKCSKCSTNIVQTWSSSIFRWSPIDMRAWRANNLPSILLRTSSLYFVDHRWLGELGGQFVGASHSAQPRWPPA